LFLFVEPKKETPDTDGLIKDDALEVPNWHLKPDWISRNPGSLSGFDCCLGNLQRNTHRQWIIAGTQSRTQSLQLPG
jgi:hypothetical protein